MVREYAVVFESNAKGWNATVSELHCIATGDTQEQAARAIREAIRAAIEFRLSQGLDVPEPSVSTHTQVANVNFSSDASVSVALIAA